jgi:tetratricopeptide (TPR) repeat protein
MKKLSQYCRQCYTLNQPEDNICRKCGNPLISSTGNSSNYWNGRSSYSENHSNKKSLYYEKYLLEQIAVLEIRLNKLTEQVEKLKKILAQQSRNSRQNPLPFASSANFFSNVNETDNYEKTEQQIRKIISQHGKPNLKLFSRLIYEGFERIEKGQIEEGLQTLEKALFMSAENHALRYFLAKSFFEADKFEKAKSILLEKNSDLLKSEPKSALILSVIYADNFEVKLAEQYLRLLPKELKSNFCALYTGFFLAVMENDWEKALKIGKKILKKNSVAEIYYLIGCVYFQLSRPEAEIFLRKAVQMDSDFSDAWFMLGNVFSKLGKTKEAEDAFLQAWASCESGSRCLELFKQKQMRNLTMALPFIKDGRRFLTNNSRRLSYLFRKELHEIL